MPTLMLLGNCVAQRLERLVEACAPLMGEGGAGRGWRVLRATPVHLAAWGPSPDAALAALAARARDCDLVFSQPLFRFGPCNTEELRARLGDRLRLFAAPNFEAYFPDVMDIGAPREPARHAPPFDWHSRILVQCRAAGVPPEEAAAIYLMHPLFREKAVAAALERTWRTYERREQGLDIGTLAVARRWYRREPLFHTWNHPAERILAVLLDGILAELGMAADARGAFLRRAGWNGGPLDDGDEAGERKGSDAPGSDVPAPARTEADDGDAAPQWSFGFNRWPIITRHHRLFGFPGREWFRVAGTRVDIPTMALAWYTWYDLHPRTFAAALDAARARPEPGR